MATTTVPIVVSAPGASAKPGIIGAIKIRAVNTYNRLRGLAGDGYRRIGADRAVSFARRYLGKARSIISSFFRAAGVIPMTLLALTSRTGQTAIKKGLGFAARVFNWVSDKTLGGINWVLRLFGSPGKRLAAWNEKTRDQVRNFLLTNAHKAWKTIEPYASPDRLYMRGTKAISYVAVAAGLISTYVSGIWVIPAYLLAAGAGVLMSPTARGVVMRSRFIETVEMKSRNEAVESVQHVMDSMLAEYGPDMNKWSTAAKSDYAVKNAILKSPNEEPEPFKGLSNNSKKKAEQWLRSFEATMHEVQAAADAALGDRPVVVDVSAGKVTPVPEPVAN